MLKHSYFKSYLATATPLQRDIATKHFNLLWEAYWHNTKYYRLLYQSRQLTLTKFRQATKENFQELGQELKERLKLI